MTDGPIFHEQPTDDEPPARTELEILGGDIPKPPAGHQTCNVHNGRQSLLATGATLQVNHLVAVPTSGPTLCGLTRFGKDADLPGWSMGGGVSGGSVIQKKCPPCWNRVPVSPLEETS